MKLKPGFSPFKFTLVALIAVLTATLLFTGCASDIDHSGHASGQSSCH